MKAAKPSAHDDAVQVDGELTAWLAHPTLSLTFGKENERRFVDYRLRRYVPLARFSLVLAIVFYVMFLIIDALSFQRFQDPSLRALVLGVSMPSCLLMLLVTYRTAQASVYQSAAVATLLLNGLSLSGVITWGMYLGVDPPHQMLMIQVLYVFFLLGIRVVLALPVTLCITAVYVGGMYTSGADGFVQYENGFMMVAMLVLGGIASRLMELAERRSWIHERELLHLSERDPLTGLYNHRLLFDRCEALMRQSRRDGKQVAIAVIDIDHFKAYNDSFGHLQGDACLRQLATVLARAARRGLDLAARLGGEEFTVVWYDVNESWAQERSERLRAEIEALAIPHPSTDRGVVTVSLGVSCQRLGEDIKAEKLLGEADKALYRAKRGGRNALRLAWRSDD